MIFSLRESDCRRLFFEEHPETEIYGNFEIVSNNNYFTRRTF